MNLEQAIREAAEIVGWTLESGNSITFTDQDCLPWKPTEERADLGAFVTLLEDWIRSKSGSLACLSGDSFCKAKIFWDGEFKSSAFANQDWLHAKLFALLELARTLR